MARCACGNATCSCVITGGTGVTVVGNGSPTRPYEIAIDTGGNDLPDILTVADTDTLDLVMVGSGTPTDKLTIYGVTKTRMSDLTDVSDPEGPQTGDVPIWQATGHWEFRPLPSGPPTTVQTGNGISGDGSGGAPVSLKYSGSWDATTQGIYGSTNNTQLVTFLDSAGQVRVPGDLIDAGVVNRLAADGLDKYPSGVSLLAISSAAATAGSWPGAGSVLTTKRNSTQGTQYWMSLPTVASGIQPWIQYRFNDNTGWSPWVDIYHDTGWVNLTPTSGTGTLAYRYFNGVVGIKGNLSGVTSVAPGASAAIAASGAIPAAYRPSTTVYAMGNGGANVVSMPYVATDGGIAMWNSSASAAVNVFRCHFTYLLG